VRGTALDVSSIRDAEWVGARLVAGDTVTEIAAAAGVSRQTAHTWIHRHRLPGRTRRRPSDNSLRDLYTTCGSIVSVAAQLDAPTATVHRWLIAAGVELRRPGAPASDGAR
jgi:transposase-like protein